MKWLVAFVLVGLAAFVALRFDALMLAALWPRGHFDASTAPRAPDYADAASWTALPFRHDAADVVPTGLRAIDQEQAPADVFYVHPTSHLGPTWNGPIDDPKLDAQTDELSTLIQATAFNGCCAVYGPRYRQAQGMAFVRESADADAAIALAYGDVRAAFRHYVEHWGRGRPFVLAGHSQGSVLAARLLAEEIAGTPLAEQLVAAYLIGAPVPVEPAPGIPACDAPEQTRCAVSWNARGPRFHGSVFDFPAPGERLCTNPLTWRRDEAPAGADQNTGAVFLHATDGLPMPGFADAQCRDGLLIVSLFGTPPRDLASRALDFVMGPENHHAIEYQLFYTNLRSNAEARVAAFLGAAR